MDRNEAKRWAKICVRSLHLLGTAAVAGGVFFALDRELWLSFWWLALGSGALLMLLDLLGNRLWLVQVRGLAVLVKLALLLLIGLYPAWDAWLLAAVILLSAVVSHAPSKLRYYSLLHGKVITSPYDTKG